VNYIKYYIYTFGSFLAFSLIQHIHNIHKNEELALMSNNVDDNEEQLTHLFWFSEQLDHNFGNISKRLSIGPLCLDSLIHTDIKCLVIAFQGYTSKLIERGYIGYRSWTG
ncbi:hypothetical protein ACJX0J_040592, partial [Zea mays]